MNRRFNYCISVKVLLHLFSRDLIKRYKTIRDKHSHFARIVRITNGSIAERKSVHIKISTIFNWNQIQSLLGGL